MLRCANGWRGLSSLPLVAGLLLACAGCPGDTPRTQKDKPAPGQPAAATGHKHTHGEKGPHGGALVAIGGDAAHLEVVLDAATGKLTAYVLDGAAQNPVPIKQEQIVINFTRAHAHDDHEDHDHEAKDHDHEGEDGHEDEADHKDEDAHEDDDAAGLPETASVTLAPVSPGADGMTAQFEGQADELKGLTEFDAMVTSITIGGTDHANVPFKYPEGNEHDHAH